MSEKEKKEDKDKWTSQLPDEVMELIMKRLCLRDCLTLRKICSSWRSTVTNIIPNKHCFPLSELPLIVLEPKDYMFFSLRTEREYCPKTSIFESPKVIYGSVEGWMIASDDVKNGSLLIFFFNPVTNRRVSIPSPLYSPSKSPIQADNLFIRKMVASSAPECYKSNCYLACLFNDLCHIAFYRPFDKSWSMIEEEDRDLEVLFNDLEIMDSKLYVSIVKPLRSILVYDLKDSTDGLPKPKVVIIRPQISTPYESRIIDNQGHIQGHAFPFLAKHEKLEQIFLIYMISNVIYNREHFSYSGMIKEYVTSPEITAVEVFKLDINKETIKWIKCESLDDNVIFVSSSKSMVMSRASLNSTQEATIRENSVYFAFQFKCHTDPWKGTLLGIKHLSNSNIKYFSIEKFNHSRVSYPFWFVPSI